MEYTVTVRATDPTGIPQAASAVPENSAEVMVTINVTDVNEAPVVTGTAAVTFREVMGRDNHDVYLYGGRSGG